MTQEPCAEFFPQGDTPKNPDTAINRTNMINNIVK